MQTLAIGPAEILIMLILSGSPGTPMGVPPGPEDPLLAKIAPAECLFYMSWASTGTPSSSSTNSVEKLLAEPKVKEFQTYLGSQFDSQMKEMISQSEDKKIAAVAPEIQRLVEVIRRKAAAIFVEEVKFGEQGVRQPPKIKAGLIVNLEGETLKVRAALDKLVTTYGVKPTTQEINKTTFNVVEFHPDAPAVSWAIAGKYLIVGIGTGAAEGILTRGRGAVPAWLTSVRERLSISRVSSVTYLNIPGILSIARQVSEDPHFDEVVDKVGVDKLGAISSVSGLNEKHFVTRALLGFNGEPKGMMSWLNIKPLTADDLKPIPGGAQVAAAFKLNPAAIFDTWMSLVKDLSPAEAQQMEDGLKDVEQKSKINIRADLLGGLGDTWTLYADPLGGGLLGGWTFRGSVRDYQKLNKASTTLMAPLVAMSNSKTAQPPPAAAPRVTVSQLAGKTVYSIAPPGVPISPSWCLTEKELLFAMSPRALQNALGPAPASSMSQNADVNKVISEGSALALGNVDMKQMIRSLYPLLQMAQAGAAQFTGKAAPFDVSKFPPVDIVEKHLANSTYALSRVQDGVEYSSFESVPGMGPQAAAPITVALLLPAVQATRTAAQRVQTSNDLRQIGLGLHNYNSVNGAFPAPYSTDSSGKPLLSWRVHVLPFIEQESLYKEFHLDEPWDSPHNLKLVEQMPDAYTSAAADPTGGKTTVLGVAGKGGLFEATKGNQPRSPKGLSLAAITDGTSNTIAVVEAPEQFAVTWTKPDDFDASVGNAAQKLCENRPGFNVLFCDGRVTYLATAIDKRILAGMFTTNGREPVPPIGR